MLNKQQKYDYFIETHVGLKACSLESMHVLLSAFSEAFTCLYIDVGTVPVESL